MIDRIEDEGVFEAVVRRINVEEFIGSGDTRVRMEQRISKTHNLFNNLIKSGLTNRILLFLHRFSIRLYSVKNIEG